MSSNRPTTTEIRSVYSYLIDKDPVHESEQEYIQWREDLMTLRPGRDHAWLDRGIESLIHMVQKRVPCIQVRPVSKVGQTTQSLTISRTYSHPVYAITSRHPEARKANFHADNQRESHRQRSSVLHPRAYQHMRQSCHYDGDRRPPHRSDLPPLQPCES